MQILVLCVIKKKPQIMCIVLYHKLPIIKQKVIGEKAFLVGMIVTLSLARESPLQNWICSTCIRFTNVSHPCILSNHRLDKESWRKGQLCCAHTFRVYFVLSVVWTDVSTRLVVVVVLGGCLGRVRWLS